MASAESHVWVGSIEGLPVVSSVKEAVEWVLAVAADDSALAKEKLNVIIARLGKVDKLKGKKSSSGYSSDSTCASPSQRSSGYSSESTSGSSSPFGKKSASLPTMHVERIPENNLVAHIIEVTGQKKKGKQASDAAALARRKKAQEVQKETLRKIERVNQNFAIPNNARPLDDYGARSRRGEHVINNDVIVVYSKVVDLFMSKRYNLPNDLNMTRPLDDNTAAAIRTELVVHFDEDELYINANALIYGEYIRVLKAALTDFLTTPTQGNRHKVSVFANLMNEEEAYVDPFAKVKWIGNQNRKRERFETIRDKVATMFNNWDGYFDIVRGKLDELFGPVVL
ncbi:uncharacterized protein LOC134068139 [Sardina pilchardus]|uniref:uncharacterized protein LOC134068139 n=1 Tax=Sardina pilchardus TaxID=27697 RepID=UPI002E0DFA78